MQRSLALHKIDLIHVITPEEISRRYLVDRWEWHVEKTLQLKKCCLVLGTYIGGISISNEQL